MIAFLADHNFHEDIIRGVRRREPAADVLLVRDVGLHTAPDPDVLEWVAREGRIVLTHDASTMPAFAWERVGAGMPMPGVFVVPTEVPIGAAVEDILLVLVLDGADEWKGTVRFLPFR